MIGFLVDQPNPNHLTMNYQADSLTNLIEQVANHLNVLVNVQFDYHTDLKFVNCLVIIFVHQDCIYEYH